MQEIFTVAFVIPVGLAMWASSVFLIVLMCKFIRGDL